MAETEKENFFEKKAGPLPTWGWFAIGGVGAVGFWVWKRRHGAGAGTSSAVTSTPVTSSATSSNPVSQDIAGLYGPVSTPGNYSATPITSTPVTSNVDVPNVVGLIQVEAEQAIAAQGLRPIGSPVHPGKTLTVDAQEPKGGAKVQAGTPVILVSTVHQTSVGTPGTGGDVTVPRVIGLKQEVAFSKIHNAGLQARGPAAVKGKTHYVVSQSPAPGRKVKKNSTVTVKSVAR